MRQSALPVRGACQVKESAAVPVPGQGTGPMRRRRYPRQRFIRAGGKRGGLSPVTPGYTPGESLAGGYRSPGGDACFITAASGLLPGVLPGYPGLIPGRAGERAGVTRVIPPDLPIQQAGWCTRVRMKAGRTGRIATHRPGEAPFTSGQTAIRRERAGYPQPMTWLTETRGGQEGALKGRRERAVQ